MAEVRRIFDKCVDNKEKGIVHGKDVYTYFKSPFSLWCNYHAPDEFRDPLSDYQQVLFDRGNNHEAFIVKSQYPNAQKVKFEDEVSGFKQMLKFMDNGSKSMHDMPLIYFPENLQGRFDIIERVAKANSIFGPYHYVVKEIKVAKNIKEHHIMQAAYYNYLLSKIQGYCPDVFYIINQEGKELEYQYDDYKENLIKAIEKIKSIIQGEEVGPVYGEALWPWESYAKSKAVQIKDVSLIPGVGSKVKKKLNKFDFLTFTDVANTSLSELIRIPGIGPVKGRQLLLNADAISSNEAIVFDKKHLQFPNKTTEIFLDLEGTDDSLKEPYIQVEYLIGCLIRDSKGEEYRPFLANEFKDEKKMFEEFIAYIKKKRSFVIYHWGSYEKSAMQKLIKKYGGVTPSLEKKLFNNMIDLLVMIKKSIAFPTFSYGLKDIAPWLGFSWRNKQVTAMETIAYYLEYVRDPDKNLEKIQLILDYNEDDVRATALVKDWLKEKTE